MNKFTHINEEGKASMVDVSGKDVTRRIAVASGNIKVSREVMDAVKSNTVKKGDVLSAARIAGIMAAKKTDELIPLCHRLNLNKIAIDFEMDEEASVIKSICTVILDGKTGAEMEALTGVSVSLLTIYDMCKAIDKTMKISDIVLEEKSGGAGGVYIRKKEKD